MISYREYIREIENNIEQNLLDQVVAHSLHILKIFPYSIDALRFLGQAYLEENKYSESKEYFDKVLSFIPDDFISHVGLSAIAEDDRDINAAIYHMELAFDTQPSNSIVQEELKRLIEVRDGEKPQKINLSKGALIRMYIKGDLFQQAKNEIESCLASSPNRIDFQILLADVLFSSSLKVQAAETCNHIIERLPYCLEANRLLYSIYLENNLLDQAKIVKERLILLNPYYQFVDTPNIDVESIDDEKIHLDKLAYTSAFSSNIEDFIPVINNSNREKTVEPSLQPFTSFMDDSLENQSKKDDQFPEFLSNAGWEKSDNPQNEPPESIYEAEFSSTPAEKSPLPDWLQNFHASSEFIEQKPISVTEEPIGIIDGKDNSSNTISNIDETISETLSTIDEVDMTNDNPQPPFENDESSNWMSQFFDEAKNSTSPTEDDKQLPEWLKSFDEEDVSKEETKDDDVPNWLKSLDSEILAKEEQVIQDVQDNSPEKKNDEPDWLHSLVTENDLATGSDQESSTEGVDSLIDQTPLDESSGLAFLDEISEKASTENSLNFQTQSENIEIQDDTVLSPESTMEVENSEVPVTADSIETVSNPIENTDNSVPDWVRSVLGESSKTFEKIEPELDAFSENIDVTEESIVDAPIEDVIQENDAQIKGAITQETSEELLAWIKELSPESGLTSPIEVANLPSDSVTPEITELLDASLDQLSDAVDEKPMDASDHQEDEFSPLDIDEELQELENIPMELTGTESDVEDISTTVPDFTNEDSIEEDSLEKLSMLVRSANYLEATTLLPELSLAGINDDEIVNNLNIMKSEMLTDFDFLQFLGDTLAGFGRFEEAMEVYTQAEKILN